MPSPTEEQIKEAIKGIINPQVKRAVMDSIVTNKRPKGWSRRSNAPYYGEFYAKQIKATVDEMLKSKQSVIYEYKTFPDLAPLTLYFRVNQSLKYLVDCMDDELKTYKHFISSIRVERSQKKGGILLSFKEEFAGEFALDFTPRSVLPDSETPKWRQKIDKYLEDGRPEDRPLIIDNLCLTPDDIRKLEIEFAGLSNIMVDITSSTIKIVKIQ